MPALVGGFTAGLLWAATGKLFTTLVLASSQMKLVYAGFAIIAASFVWTYLGWLILLIGAQLAFYVQNPNYLRLGHAVLRLSSRELELLALDVMVHVGDALRAGQAPWSVDALSRKLGLPGIAVADMAGNLERAGLLAQADDGTLFPARELTRHQADADSRLRPIRQQWARAVDARGRAQRVAIAGGTGAVLARGLRRSHAGGPDRRAALIRPAAPQAPAMVISSSSTEPVRMAPRSSTSDPMARTPWYICRRLPAMVTSCTG